MAPRLDGFRIPLNFPTSLERREWTAILVVALAVSLTAFLWVRSMEEKRSGLAVALGSLADEAISAIESRLGHEVDASRDLATLWRLGGAQDGPGWESAAQRTLASFPGIQWVAWVPGDATRARFLARDPALRTEPEALGRIRMRFARPSPAIEERWTDAYELDVFVPVGSNDRTAGILASSIRIDSAWLQGVAPLAIRLTSDRGRSLDLQPSAAGRLPPWMQVRRSFTSPSGHVVRVDLSPSPSLARQMEGHGDRSLPLTGVVLALPVGFVVFRLFRAGGGPGPRKPGDRESGALLGELSRRDRELRELKEVLERRVRERTAELSRALDEAETFSHSMSHDLRSPLGAILNYAVVLERGRPSGLSDEERRAVTRIREAAERATYLLNDMLEFAGSGARPLVPRMLDMEAVVERACAEVVAGEPERGNVRFEIDPLPPAYGDPLQVHRILVNLLGNALKYSRGQPQREVRVGGTSDRVESTFWVKDNGPGFEPSSAHEIFKPFRRLGDSKREGVGLGLTIVARTVRRHGGRVWAESDGNRGAGIYFTLPGSESQYTHALAGAARG